MAISRSSTAPVQRPVLDEQRSPGCPLCAQISGEPEFYFLTPCRVQHNAAYVAFDVVGSPQRYCAPTGHVLIRGTTIRDVSPHFDDLRPLDLQEPK